MATASGGGAGRHARGAWAGLLACALATGCRTAAPAEAAPEAVVLHASPVAVRARVEARAGGAAAGRAVLRLEEVGYDGASPGVAYAVYVDGSGGAGRGRYVGNLSFYASPGARRTVELDVTDALRGAPPASVRVTFVPVSTQGGDAERQPPAGIGRVSVTIIP